MCLLSPHFLGRTHHTPPILKWYRNIFIHVQVHASTESGKLRRKGYVIGGLVVFQTHAHTHTHTHTHIFIYIYMFSFSSIFSPDLLPPLLTSLAIHFKPSRILIVKGWSLQV